MSCHGIFHVMSYDMSCHGIWHVMPYAMACHGEQEQKGNVIAVVQVSMQNMNYFAQITIQESRNSLCL